MEAFFPATVGTAGALVLALFAIYSALRKDNARRFDRYTDKLEKRVAGLEALLQVEQRRRYGLEGILRAAGVEIPTWDDVTGYGGGKNERI